MFFYVHNKLSGNSRMKTHHEGKHLNLTKAFLGIKSCHSNNDVAHPTTISEETLSVQTKQELTHATTPIFPAPDPSLSSIPGLVYE